MYTQVDVVGFRNLECSNLFLLEKQCWRLLQEPDSLCHCFNNKILSTGQPFECQAERGLIFVWQSIMVSLEAFKSAYIWRVAHDSD